MALEPNLKPRRAPSLAVALAVLIAVLVAGCMTGCGSSSRSTGTAADPAGAVPSSVPVYASAVVRPDEPLLGAARSAGQTLTHQADPYDRLLGALRTPGSPALDFKRDLAPWLGARAGIFLASAGAAGASNVGQVLSLLSRGLLGGSQAAITFPFSAHGVQGAIVLDTTDVAKARSFLDAQATRAGAHASSYRGVSFEASPSGVAFGVVDRFAVIGTESALRSVIDTTLGGPSLAHAVSYATLLAAAPAGALAHLYANTASDELSTGAGATSAQGAPTARATAPRPEGLEGALRLLVGTPTVNVSLVPSATSIALDVDTLPAASSSSGGAGRSAGMLRSLVEGSTAVGELPGEAWLAFGLGDLTGTLAEDVQAMRGLTSLSASLTGSGSGASSQPPAGITVQGLFDGILAPLSALGEDNAEARRDFQRWMDSAGIFASGSGLFELKGGVVIGSRNAALSRAAVGELAAKLRKDGDSVQPVSVPGTEASAEARITGLPVALDIAAADDAGGQAKFVIGIGAASITAALHPPSTLSDAGSTSAAVAALGGGIKPSVLVNFPTLLGLLEGVGLIEDPTVSPFVPYLRSLTTLAGGERSLGKVDRFRLVVGLHAG